MKKIIITIGLIVLSIIVKSQSWYAIGNLDTLGNTNGNKSIRLITFYSNKIIIGGNFKRDGSQFLNGVAQWSGNSWEPMGVGEWFMVADDSVGDGGGGGTTFRNHFFLTGSFQGAGGGYIGDTTHYVGNIAKWNGVDWYPLTGSYPPFCGFNGGCYAVQAFNNNLYVGGLFGASYDATGSHTTQGIAKWNDTVFSSCGQLAGDFAPGYFNAVVDFCTFQNKLIAGGFFTSIDGSAYGTYSGIAAWDGTTWSPIGVGFNNAVWSLSVYNNELYAGGLFTATRDNLTPLNHIAKWDGTNWTQVGEGLNDTVFTLCVDSLQNKLYAGGGFTQTGLGMPAKHIAEWTGTNWLEVGGGTNRRVGGLFSKDSNLYVGGEFTRAGNVQASLIAVWGYGLSVGVGRELGIRNDELGIYPNPSNGAFTINWGAFDKLKMTEIKEVKIYDVIGRSFDKLRMTEIGNNSATVDLSDVAKGIYFVEVMTEKGVIRKKVVKE